MRARLLLLLPVLTVAAAAPATATPPSLTQRIVPGVTAGGVDLSELTALQAAQKLKAQATPALTATPVVLTVAGKRSTLSAEDAALKVNGLQTARAALALAEPGEVPLVVSHSEKAVSRFVAGVARKVRRSPRNATLSITLRRLVVRRAKAGRGLDANRARRHVNAALSDPSGDRNIRLRLSKLRAPINADDVRRQNRSVITIDKSNFKLRLFTNLKFSRSYGVAVGQPAYPTPSGRFSITSKQVNPVWSVPNSPWAGELQGTTVAGGSAANPLKARWMGLAGGIGIHGTGEEYSIGTRASHGCIRMRVADVVDLFSRVPAGTAVLIG